MSSRIATCFFVLALGCPVLALAQVYSSDRPPPYLAQPVAFGTTGSQIGSVSACTGGPTLMMTAALGGGSVVALGAEDKQWTIAEPWDFDDFGGIGEGIIAIANTWGQDLYYVGFQHPYYSSHSWPILTLTPSGLVDLAVTSAELDAVASEPVIPWGLTPTADGLVYARLHGKTSDTVVRIDPMAPEGERVSLLFDAVEVEDALPPAEGMMILHWGAPLAADQQGRTWFTVHYNDGSALTGSDMLLVRRDADGSFHQLTDIEPTEVYGEVTLQKYRPANGVMQGLIYDPELDLLIGSGQGVWVIDPEVKNQYRWLIPTGVIDTMAYFFTDGDAAFGGGGVLFPRSCLGFKGAAGVRSYGAKSSIYYSFAVFGDELDMDRDDLPRRSELLLGTDPRNVDTDGDGASDGAEFLDGTDPLDSSDIRVFREQAQAWSMSGRFFGSKFQHTLAGSVVRWGATLIDGTFGINIFPGGADTYDFYRFTDWDEEAQKSDGESCESPIAAYPSGDLVCSYHYVSKEGAYLPADGSEVSLLLTEDQREFTNEFGQATDVVTRADGTLFSSWNDGKVLRHDPDGDLTVLYDGRLDMEKAGIVHPDTDNWCMEYECQCRVSAGPITYDPTRGLLFFYVQDSVKCGTAPAGVNPLLVVMHQNGTLQVMSDHDDMDFATLQYGGQTIQDIEPDFNGGLWILSTASIDVSLFHLDNNWRMRAVEWFKVPSGHPPYGSPEGLIPKYALAHASELIATPDGRLFIMPMRFYNQYPPGYFLAEIRPIEPIVKPGFFVTVHGGERSLGILDPEGAGMSLHFGDPLVTPMSVAASTTSIFVGDVGAEAIWHMPVKPDGTTEPMVQFADGFVPGGMDIAESGHLLAVDTTSAQVLRFAPDGQSQVVVAGGMLIEPRDVAAEEGGSFVVSDAAAGRVYRFDNNGSGQEAIAEVPGADGIAIDDGRGYIVSSVLPSTPPVRLEPGPGGGLVADSLGGQGKGFDLSNFSLSGGVSVDSKGNVYWLAFTNGGQDTNGSQLLVRIIRITRDGFSAPLIRSGLGASDKAGFISRIHEVGEAWPRRPGVLPPWPETGDGPQSDTVSSPADIAQQAQSPELCETSSGGGCSTGGSSYGWLLFLALLGALAFLRLRTARTAAACTLLVGMLACSSDKTMGPCPVGQSDATTSDSVPAYTPDYVAPQCKGKTLCPPGHGSVCTGDESYQICQMDTDGCYVWSPTVSCSAGQSCKDGACTLCTPDCHGVSCGDDGCGGSCGQCEAPDTCCHGYCAPCQSDCSAIGCGDDGSGSSCGTCEEDTACFLGQCTTANTRNCRDYAECVGTCWPWDNYCFEQCEYGATAGAVGAQGTLQGCSQTRCSDCFALAQPEAGVCLDKCLVFLCPEPFGSCISQGTTVTCPQLTQCLLECGEEPACMVDCFDQDGVVLAANYFHSWTDCVREECGFQEMPSMDDPCLIQAAEGPCAEFHTLCFP